MAWEDPEELLRIVLVKILYNAIIKLNINILFLIYVYAI